MRDLLILVVHIITTVFRLARPGGLRAVVAESVLTKHQMLILNRSRRRAPNLRIQDRFIAGLCSLWIKPSRLRKVALAFKTSTLLSFHRAPGSAQVSSVVFTEAANKTRTQRPGGRSNPCRCRDEKAQFDVGMPQDSRSDQPRFRNIYK